MAGFMNDWAHALEAPHPLAHHSTAGLPEPGGLGNGARSLAGLHELASCFGLVHGVDLVVR